MSRCRTWQWDIKIKYYRMWHMYLHRLRYWDTNVVEAPMAFPFGSHIWRGNTYTGCHRRNGANFGRVFLMLNYTDITQNNYIQSWTVTEIMAIEKCGLLWCPRTVSRPWRHIHPLRMPGNEKPLANIGMQWRWRNNAQLLPLSITWEPKANATVVRVFL